MLSEEEEDRGQYELEDALAFFYDSDTYALMSEGVADNRNEND